jgi:hypothetical protein
MRDLRRSIITAASFEHAITSMLRWLPVGLVSYGGQVAPHILRARRRTDRWKDKSYAILACFSQLAF